MAVQFTHEVGFYGLAAIQHTTPTGSAPALTDYASLLATGGDVTLNHDPIFSSGVWGAGWYNAAEQVAFALNSLRITGSVSFELSKVKGSTADAFTAIKKFGFEERADTHGHYVKLLPQGKAGYVGPGWCESCSFDASVDSVVTGSMNFASGNMGKDYWRVDPATYSQAGARIGEGNHPGVAPSTPPTAATGDDFLCLYPYWATKVFLNSGTTTPPAGQIDDIISWNANYSSEVNFLTLCKGTRNNAPDYPSNQEAVEPDYIMVGSMTADGSLSIFKVSELLQPIEFHDNKALTIYMYPGHSLATQNYIKFANVMWSSGNPSMQTGGTYIQTDFSFTAVGDGTAPPMSLG